MSGEYYCIEEVVDPSNYYEECDNKSSRSRSAGGRRSFPNSRENDNQSTTSRKSQDFRLYEIEEQLEVAENRCNTLKTQLDSMKKIYNKSGKTDRSPISKADASFISKNDAIETTFVSKTSRKRPSSPPAARRSRPCSLTRKRPSSDDFHESSDTIPQKSSSSSTGVANTAMMRPKETFMTPLIRQNSSSIGTDHTGAAVRTINNILTGITDSVNRLSQLHANESKKAKKKKTKEAACSISAAGTVFMVPLKPFSPRVDKRIFEQQRKMIEIANSMEVNNEKSSGEDYNRQNYSSTSIKSKTPSRSGWSRHTSVKTPKTKIQSSSASVNLSKNIKSSAKHVENTTKIRSVRTGMIDEDSHSTIFSRKRRRSVKRLKTSKLSLVKKLSDHSTKPFDQFTTDNLVELYHNIAAKASDSEDSNHASKSQIGRQKAGGDLALTSVQAVPKFQIKPDEIAQKKPITKIFQASRALTPINENGLADNEINFNKTECFSNLTKNYELPTIASKMKQVTKSYLRSFNFRSIPFCAAKSTSPSHNIGINIQQVMSIIKTRQPITGISPTLAHNISLAAGKLQNRPLTVLVSTLSSKMGYPRLASQCPLRHQLNYNQLQEMAKEIQEEPYEEPPNFAGDSQNVTVDNSEVFSRGPCGDREEPHDTVWSLDPATQQRCTCVSQKGVPFQQVLSKYQMSSDAVCVDTRPQTSKSHIAQRYTKSTFYPTMVRKQRTRNWIRNDASQAQTVVSKQTVDKQAENKQAESLRGKERNLKTVLKNLHDEFESLNTRYEDLAKQVSKNDEEASEETVKELEEMEKALNKKEEEINMVMALYTEVLALKEQVKKLKERTSQPSVILTNNPSRTPEYKETKAALHLTQLLRQIQNYQMRCKSNV